MKAEVLKTTYNIRDLMARYSCAASTIYRRMKHDGYPRPTRYTKGGSNVWSIITVHAWERIHMPQLHSTEDDTFVIEDAEKWAKIIATHERLLVSNDAKPKAVKSNKRWEDVQREGREVIASIKKRHGKKPVAAC